MLAHLNPLSLCRMYLDKDIAIPSEMVHKYSDTALVHINTVIKELRRLFLVEDLVDSLKVCSRKCNPDRALSALFDLGLHNCSQGNDWEINLDIQIPPPKNYDRNWPQNDFACVC